MDDTDHDYFGKKFGIGLWPGWQVFAMRPIAIRGVTYDGKAHPEEPQ
ncbi:MAG: hypothetical protein AAF252_01960 [Pseudomonadota bacterium]